MTPHESFQTFLQKFMSNQFGVAFEMFSTQSKTEFLNYTFDLLKQRYPDAIRISGIGLKEVEMMFKQNEKSLIHSFWKNFYFNSGSQELYQFGAFETNGIQGNKATVHCVLTYPNGQEGEVDITMIKEGASWKYGYIESGLTL
jgi:hypothetical protein